MAQETTAQPNTTTTATDLASYQQFALEQQAQNNAWSAEQAQKQMDFQKEMSDTAHQREVADLKAAGLNPILSVNSGASVPNGAAGDIDTSAAGNVGGILQQVLQAQSAREVAGMYNAATLAAASIAANASMYGSDMAYWNAEDHPGSIGTYYAYAMQKLFGSHAPGTGSSPHDNNGAGSSGAGVSSAAAAAAAAAGGAAYNLPAPLSKEGINYLLSGKADKVGPVVDPYFRDFRRYANQQMGKKGLSDIFNKMTISTRLKFSKWLASKGFKGGFSRLSSLPMSSIISLLTGFAKSQR